MRNDVARFFARVGGDPGERDRLCRFHLHRDLEQITRREFERQALVSRPNGAAAREIRIQAVMRDHVQPCGFNYLCTDNVDEAIDWLKQHSILRRGLTVQ